MTARPRALPTWVGSCWRTPTPARAFRGRRPLPELWVQDCPMSREITLVAELDFNHRPLGYEDRHRSSDRYDQ
jgi:hypothetical protein